MTSSNTRRVYFYVNDAWHYLEFVVSGTGTSINIGGVPGGSDTHVQFNSGGVFGGNSGFTYIAQSAITIGRDMLMTLNNNSGSNTYFLYRSSNNYLEYYLNGELRLQI